MANQIVLLGSLVMRLAVLVAFWQSPMAPALLVHRGHNPKYTVAYPLLIQALHTCDLLIDLSDPSVCFQTVHYESESTRALEIQVTT